MAICIGPCLTINDAGELTVEVDPRVCNGISCGDDGLFSSRTDIESELAVAFGPLDGVGPNTPYEAGRTYRETSLTVENDDPCGRTMEVDWWFSWGGGEAFMPAGTTNSFEQNSRLFLEYQIAEDVVANYASHAALKADGLGPGGPTVVVGQGGTSTYRTNTVAPGASKTWSIRTLCNLAQQNANGQGPLLTDSLSVYAITILAQKRWE